MARDKFSLCDIRILGERVTFLCSNPVCNARTTGPKAEFTKRISNGKACHIHAASPKGPLYDPNMSREERGGIGNAIWRCDRCARTVDDDHARYSAELLKGWKSHAKEKALKQLGIPQTQQNAVEMLTQALRGHPSKFIKGALPNVAGATKNVLEAQNPGLDFDLQFIDGVSTYIIRPSPRREIPIIEFIPKSEKEAQEFSMKLIPGWRIWERFI